MNNAAMAAAPEARSGKASLDAAEVLRSRLFVNVVEAATLLGKSIPTVHRWIAAGELPSRKIGQSRLVPVAAIRDLLETDAA